MRDVMGLSRTLLYSTDDRDLWLEARRSGLGASDIAGIVGLSPYTSKYRVWAEKTGRIPDADPSEQMRWGLLLEAAIRAEVATRIEESVTNAGALVQHPDVPWALATIDGEVWDESLIEIKNSTDYTWDEVPDHIQIQVQWQMYVTGYKHAWVACLHHGVRLELYEIDRDDSAIEALVAEASKFWDLVVEDTPPDLDGSQATSAAVAAVYPDALDITADLDDDADVLALERDVLVAEIKARETRKTEIDSTFKTMLGEAKTGETPDGRTIRWTAVNPQKVDLKWLEEKRPEIVSQFTRTVGAHRRLTVGKAK